MDTDRREIVRRLLRFALWIIVLASLLPRVAVSQAPDPSVLQRIDAANQARFDHVLSFSDTEHYAVFRGQDETHPAAEITVKMTYRKGEGKNYEIVSRSGSQIIQEFGLEPLIENEKAINDPAKVQESWFTTTNYDMQPKPGDTRQLNGEACVAIAIAPRRKAPNMIDGTMWVDPRDGTIAEVDGIASKRPSVFAGTTHMTRQYSKIDGFAMATHARAESHNAIFGRTVVTIDYSDYNLHLRPDE